MSSGKFAKEIEKMLDCIDEPAVVVSVMENAKKRLSTITRKYISLFELGDIVEWVEKRKRKRGVVVGWGTKNLVVDVGGEWIYVDVFLVKKVE